MKGVAEMTSWKEPFYFPNGSRLKNRLIFAPISTMSSNGIGQLSESELAFYQQRSKVVGMIILGSAYVSVGGKAYQNNVGLASDAVIPNLRRYNKRVKADGALSIVQLYHGGRAVDNQKGRHWVSVVSRLANDPDDYRVLSEKDILAILESFGAAIRRARKAGFDGIELHAGSPFLIQEFLSAETNQRTDQWGGNEERCFLFLKTLILLAIKIRDKSDESFVIGIRLAMSDQSETQRLVDWLNDLGIDYIHFNQNNLQHIKSKVPLIANGGIETLEEVASAMVVAPLVSVARPLILQAGFPFSDKRVTSIEQIDTLPKGLLKSITDSPDWYFNRQ